MQRPLLTDSFTGSAASAPLPPPPPPPPRFDPSFRPHVDYVNASVTTADRVLNATVNSINATIANVTEAVRSTVAPTTTTTTTTTTAAQTAEPWLDDLNKMTTTSVSENLSQLSVVHLLAWFMLFAALTMTTVVLLNWCLRSRQSAAEEDEEEEEMPLKAFTLPSSSSTQGTLAEGTASASSSSNRLLATRGNLARQQFLESRKAGNTAKSYGGTDST